MKSSTSVFWLPVGFIISVVDALLSIASMAGIMHAVNLITDTMAAVVGFALTAFAVYLPRARANARESVPPMANRNLIALSILWFVLTVLDVGTSVIGAIWYGMLHHPVTESVNFSDLHFDPGNSFKTLAYVAFVLIVAWCCTRFGQALVSFRKGNDSQGRQTTP